MRICLAGRTTAAIGTVVSAAAGNADASAVLTLQMRICLVRRTKIITGFVAKTPIAPRAKNRVAFYNFAVRRYTISITLATVGVLSIFYHASLTLITSASKICVVLAIIIITTGVVSLALHPHTFVSRALAVLFWPATSVRRFIR